MLLARLLTNLWAGRPSSPGKLEPSLQPRVLCVGGPEQYKMLPAHYVGWERELLSSEPTPEATVVQDLFKLDKLAGNAYDAIFFGHGLKNQPIQHVGRILYGFRHLLRPGGFVHIIVPDVVALMRHMLENGKDLEDSAYMSPSGPISYHDVFYGRSLSTSGPSTVLADPHLCGYSAKVLQRVLFDGGFIETHIIELPESFEAHAIAGPDPILDRFKLIMGLL